MGRSLVVLAVLSLTGTTMRAEEPSAGEYYVQGDVNHPSRLPVAGGVKVLDALKQAGGLMPSADRTKVRLVRPASGNRATQILSIDYEQLVSGKDLTTNYRMVAGDRIQVYRKSQ